MFHHGKRKVSLAETRTVYNVGSMRVRIQHQTRYDYDEPAALGPHLLRLRPAHHARAHLLSYNLTVEPAGAELRWQHDPWGNRVVRLTFPEGFKTTSLVLTVDAAFDIRPVNPFDFFVDERCQRVPFAYPPEIRAELGPYLDAKAPGPLLGRWLAETPFEGYVTDFLVALNSRVAADVRYIIRDEPGVQSSEETLALRSGSCRDSALLLVDALRALGLAARFVSGYLVQLTDEGNIPDLARGVSTDVVDLHAWAEVYVPGAGWIGLDGTSGLLCNEGHIALACTASPEQASPVEGTASLPARFSFSQNVSRLGHEPTPHKPYTDEQWGELLAAGARVDEVIAASGLVLTVGGEPTWTSRENPREPEWITEALGPTKWSQGLRMARELASRFGHGALVLHRMGKLYPGESLPRWNLQLLWRQDGVPVWRDGALLALDPAPPARRASADDARRFGEVLAARLGVEPRLVPGHEDPWAYLHREENLPLDVDLAAVAVDDPEERRTLARTLERGVGAVVGYALPLSREEGSWQTDVWTFRRERMYLIFGDSPMGLRLPLERIGGEAGAVVEQDVTLGAAPLPTMQRPGVRPPPRPVEPGKKRPRTALCVEPRGGVLQVFLPPLPSAEGFLELIGEVEATAEELGLPVRLEGYGPPGDPRLQSCLVTPDPGVIEINVPVSRTLGEYVGMLEKVAEAALHAGLSTEKYQIDGREVGSGGGNHITLGGPTTAESPWLRRPDLLGSLLRYVQNHPSLSFLFTGLFVGPTSQAPRVDEARHDGLRELELALSRLPPEGADAPPWFVDRLLRNLLTDVAGNTHRTEICIDKLYDPAGLAGRQGLVEFRAFEMPPHERLAVAQVLLLRAITAMFLREPCRRPLIRWGTELHDRFMMPHYLWADFRQILAELAAAGLPLDEAWFQPFLDHRFPVLGTFTVDDITLELRPALEPWPVLGEEAAGATVSRYVDSSLERLQLRVDGMTEGRYQVLVNGLLLPLRPTGRAGERIAGVRFRAWQPPHCLHPHIGLHHPLRFDLVDTWGKRSLGACTYHVWHPDGRAYEDPPLTAFEAGARRAQRFTTEGHLPWPVRAQATEVDPEHPYTLDLRRYPVDRRG
jgi:uncharacterized protein (DUF2126 family)